MPLSLSSVVMAEKNRLASGSVWYDAMEITIPGVSEQVRIVRNNENIGWRLKTWVAFPFELDEIGEESKGEVPQVQVRVANVSRAMEAYLQDYDIYCKTNGNSPILVSIYVLNSLDLANTEPVAQFDYELVKPKTDAIWALFSLGTANIFDRRFPPNRMTKDYCRYFFKIDPRCGYSGGETECNKTLFRCRELLNSNRFGGCPGLGSGGIRLVGA